MILYKVIYVKYFNYGEQDFIPCELCDNEAVDVHHIDHNRKNNKITNLMGLCRDCHNKDGIYSKEFFQKAHNEFI